MALNIYLIRHGKTVWNIEGRLQGSGDSPLVEEGILGAKKTGQALKKDKVDSISACLILESWFENNESGD